MADLPQSDRMLRKSMRHLANIDQSNAQVSDPSKSLPQDWFDLSQSQLIDLGAFFFLASLTRFHRPRSLAGEFANFEPALRLNQYRIFRSNGFPRSFMTWAGLNPPAERKFAVDQCPLAPEDWNSGTSKWVVDWVAPFGHTAQMIKVLAKNDQELCVRTLWHNRTGTRARVIEWSRVRTDAPIQVSSYGRQQFARVLEGK
ncbi:hemolysin-activating ACP:hemolysin acyltransferase [Yoonia maritima]|uniref:RTX toxin-activating lysine-acyltransferase n=1 Tax=Yoonia maritima TaxID=1435347 RepID=A0A2T0W544_9RHOB|nr:toxin-activating lysine-acyltransferase [Yoonia maritima]PRY80372.1 hemolysin-activating ACP:hemolysin acyltransferase [Yoonia maritima]